MTTDDLLQRKQVLESLAVTLSNTWQQTQGKIALIKELIAEMEKEPGEGVE